MPVIQIPTIDYTNGQISNCIIKIDSQTFNVKFVDGNYQVAKDASSVEPSPEVTAPVITAPAPVSTTQSSKNTVLPTKNTVSSPEKKKKVGVSKTEPAPDANILATQISNFMNAE